MELSTLCKDVVTTYHAVVQVVSEQAVNLTLSDEWVDDLQNAQVLLKAGAKQTQNNIDALMGAEDGLESSGMSTELELDSLTSEQIDAWNEIALSAEIMDGADAEEVLNTDSPSKQITYEMHVARLGKFGNRVMKNANLGS